MTGRIPAWPGFRFVLRVAKSMKIRLTEDFMQNRLPAQAVVRK
jgi:hypothetical protein